MTERPSWFDDYVRRVTEAYNMPRSTAQEAVDRFGAFAAILVEFEAAFERMYAAVQGGDDGQDEETETTANEEIETRD